MKQSPQIDTLLERFYNGETSRNEELLLRQLLSDPAVAASHQADASMFDALDSFALPPNLKTQILYTIDSLDRNDRVKRLKLRRWFKRAMTSAASIAIVCGIGYGVFSSNDDDILGGMSADEVGRHTELAISLLSRSYKASYVVDNDLQSSTDNFEADF